MWQTRHHKQLTSIIGLTFIALFAAMVWGHRVRAANETSEFVPASPPELILPEGTAIQAVIVNGISRYAADGDTVMASVSDPIVVDGKLSVPRGSELMGELQNVVISHSMARAKITFDRLMIGTTRFQIETQPLLITAPLAADINILGAAVRTFVGASLGAAVGATSGDVPLIGSAMFEGAGSTPSPNTAVQLKVIVLRAVRQHQ